MISEAIHSVIDSISQVLLIFGIKSSKKAADIDRPFGYGREFYFWSFVVSLVIFLLGGCISFYEGVQRLKQSELKGSATWSYIILGISFLFTAVSMLSALKAFNKQRGSIPFLRAVIDSKDPSTFIVLMGDIGDMLGLFVAFLGIYLGRLFHNPHYDGIASMVIGLILIGISGLLVRESKSLLMGEPISRKTMLRLATLAESDHAIIKVKKQFSTYLAPDEVLLELIAVFKKGLTTREITDAIDRVIKMIQLEFPRIKQIFIEPVSE